MRPRPHIAVAGTGAIGAMMGGWLTWAGQDVTLLSAARRSQAELLNRRGLSLEGYGPAFHTPVKAAFLPELAPAEQFDWIFLTMKSNQLEGALPGLVAHLAPEGILVPMENGINDELLCRFVPPERVITCVTFAGGAQLEPGRFMNHDGVLYVGRRDGRITPQVRELAAIASAVRPATATDQIRSFQWDKLARVCLSVPTACVSGQFLGDVFLHPETQTLFARLALELFDVSAADGCPRDTVEEKTRAEWREILDGTRTGLERAGEFKPWPPGIVDAYTADIRRGQPLEIDYTNGAVVRLGRQYGVPTPANAALLAAVHAVERGEAQAGPALLRQLKHQLSTH